MEISCPTTYKGFRLCMMWKLVFSRKTSTHLTKRFFLVLETFYKCGPQAE